MDASYLLKGCEKCPYSDKSRPLYMDACKLIIGASFELPTFLSAQ